MSGLVSILMTSFNHGNFIRESIQSIINQSYQEWELIIVDDCSTDNTIEIINSFKEERLRYFQNESNIGISETLNILLSKAKGEYIGFAASDDLSCPNRLATQVNYLNEHTEVGFVFSKPVIIDRSSVVQKNLEIARLFDVKLTSRVDFLRYFLFHGNCLFASSGLGYSKIVKKVGQFGPTLHQLQDLDYWIRILEFTNIAIMGQPVACWRYEENSDSASAVSNTSKNRTVLEYIYLWKRYRKLSPTVLAEILDIPSDLGLLDIQYHFAQKILQQGKTIGHIIIAHEILNELVLDSPEYLKSKFGFDYKKLINLAEYNNFSLINIHDIHQYNSQMEVFKKYSKYSRIINIFRKILP